MKFSTNIPKYFKYVKILKDKVNLKVPNNLKNYELTTEKVNILVTRTLSGVGIGAVPIENIKSSTNTSDTVINSGPTNQPFEFEPEVVKSVAKKNLQPLTESSGISGVWISQKYSANISDTVINSGPINQSFEFEQEIVQSVAKETLQPLTEYSGISGVWILQKCGEYLHLHLDFSLLSCNYIVLKFGIPLLYKGTKSLFKLYRTRRDTKKFIQGKHNTKLRLP